MLNNYRVEMALQWSHFIVGVSILLLSLVYWYRRPNKFPPGPRGVPILGYLPFLDKLPESTVLRLSQKYGKILSVRLGSQDVVFLNDYASTYALFIKQGSRTAGRPIFAPLEPLYKNVGIVFFDYGKEYKSQKKFGFATLRGFGVGKKGMELTCLEELSYLVNEIQSHNGTPTDYLDLFHCVTANNICTITLGKRFEYNDDHFKTHLKIILNSFNDPMMGLTNNLITFLPYLRHIPPFLFYHKKYLHSVKEFFAWIDGIIEEHKQTYDEFYARDFIDAFIKEMNKNTDSSFTDFQLSHYIGDLFVAGTETTASTLLWALLCLLHYPQVQSRLREEVLKVFGSSGIITMSKKSEMPYTCAFLQELLRYRTLSPLTLPHQLVEDVKHDEYIIPKGTVVFSNITAIHNDPNLWEEPTKFNPERFLDDQGNFIFSNHVIPFSVGPRRCLGEQLANMEMFIIVVGLIQKFEFLPDPNDDTLPSIDEGVRSLAFVPNPYKLIAKEYDS